MFQNLQDSNTKILLKLGNSRKKEVKREEKLKEIRAKRSLEFVL